jgi:hypothetical protein
MPDPIQTRTEADAINDILKGSLSRTIPYNEFLQAVHAGFIAFQDKTILNLETLMGQPVRKRASVTTYDVASFIAYVLAHRKSRQTAVFLNLTSAGATFTAIIDYHPAGDNHKDAAWGDHTCQLVL